MAEQREHREPYVFISYASPDRERAMTLADVLEESGIRVWLDRRNLVGGSSWDASIVEAIKNCTVFLLLASSRSVTSPNVKQELRLSWEEQRPALPLLLDPVVFPDEMRYILAGRQWVERFDRPQEVWLPAILQALAGLGLPAQSRRHEPTAPAHTASPPTTHTGPTTNLPTPLSSFLGREQELTAIRHLLARTRLLTLTGPGGIGKTRLAIEAARSMLADFPDGVFFVNLAPVRDPALVPSTIAQALNIPETSGQTLLDSLRLALQSKTLLLVLDNLEQVVEAAPAIAALLEGCAGIKALVTSRVLLRLAGEHEYQVPPLPLPDPAPAPRETSVAAGTAVDLFVQRAREVKPDFDLTAELAPVVTEICRRLDGLPLALELAAARMKVLSAAALLRRLEHRLPLLTGGPRNLPGRQQTLRDAIAWSYDLLTPAEQLLFRRLGVFVGGCRLEAAEAVYGDEIDVLDGLTSLVDHSLLVQREDADGEPRFLMLETLREFALEQLQASGEEEALRRRHAEYFAALVEPAEEGLAGREWRDWQRRLLAELGNVRAALRWAADIGEAELGLRLVGALWMFWWQIGRIREGLKWLQELLSVPGGAAPTGVRGQGLFAAGILSWMLDEYAEGERLLRESVAIARPLSNRRLLSLAAAQLALTLRGDLTEARALAEEGVAVAKEVGSNWLLAQTYDHLGIVAARQGDFATARSAGEMAGAIHHTTGADHLAALCRNDLGTLALRQGDYAAARREFEACLAVYREVGDTRTAARALSGLGRVAYLEGARDQAVAYFEESVTLSRESGNRRSLADGLSLLTVLVAGRGETERAHRLLTESLGLYREQADVAGIAACMAGIAYVAQLQGEAERAARLFGAAEAQREASGGRLPSIYAALYQETVDALRGALGEAAFTNAWARGRALTLEQAVAAALAAPTPNPATGIPHSS